jgi:tRNA(Ile)-lysidine synthase
MIEEVRRQMLAYRLTTPGAGVLVAVSGGADSVALLHVLRALHKELDVRLCAAHLDHALRDESGDEADFVQRLCADWAVPLISRRVAVRDTLAPGIGGLEQAARQVRRHFLHKTMQEAQCQLIALGHHRGDQAETFLQRLLRGAGPGGLAAMQPRTDRFIRPLLSVARSDILAYLGRHNLTWVEDASNQDLSLTRNRIRHELLPQLATFNPRIEEHLGRLAARFALEEDFWQSLLAQPTLCDGEVRLPAEKISSLHPALRDRTLRQAIQSVRGNLRGIEEKHVDAVVDLLQRDGGEQKVCHLPGLWAARTRDVLRLRSAPPGEGHSFHIIIEGPGTYALPGGRCLHVQVVSAPLAQDNRQVEFSMASVQFPLVLRSRLPGDRICLAGLDGHKKIKKIFIELGVPREERSSIPILAQGNEILWLAGLRRCVKHQPGSSEGKILRVILYDAKIETLGL